jgi:hypothetical protein
MYYLPQLAPVASPQRCWSSSSDPADPGRQLWRPRHPLLEKAGCSDPNRAPSRSPLASSCDLGSSSAADAHWDSPLRDKETGKNLRYVNNPNQLTNAKNGNVRPPSLHSSGLPCRIDFDRVEGFCEPAPCMRAWAMRVCEPHERREKADHCGFISKQYDNQSTVLLQLFALSREWWSACC